MTPEEHYIYCTERVQMFMEMMKRCYPDMYKEN